LIGLDFLDTSTKRSECEQWIEITLEKEGYARARGLESRFFGVSSGTRE
jgi:hypothetical protein